MKNDILEERLSGIDSIPSLPLVLRQIQKIMENPRSNMTQISAVVAKDQALASRVIRLVNSAYYARRTQVASINQAIIALGLDTLRNLMLGLSVVKMFRSSEALGFDPSQFWKHSFGAALCCRKLAQLLGKLDPEELFIAGLLHDMGRLVMEQFLHEDFEKALRITREKKGSLLAGEIEVFGFSHADAGGWLGRKWKIPESLIAAMEFHHFSDIQSAPESEYRELTLVTGAASELCHAASIGNSGDSMSGSKCLEALKISPAQIQTITGEVTREITTTLKEWGEA